MIIKNKDNKNDICLISFEGKLIKYNLENRKFNLKSEKNIRNFLSSDTLKANTNPPYISCANFDSNNNIIMLGLMNGIGITFKSSSMKKNSFRSFYDCGILKYQHTNFDNNYQFTIGKNNVINLIKAYDKTVLSIDLKYVYDDYMKSINSNTIYDNNIKKESSFQNDKIIEVKANNQIKKLGIIDVITTCNKEFVICDTFKESIKILNLKD